jgi:glycosyltransferase involved in cell wall biosynthesis
MRWPWHRPTFGAVIGCLDEQDLIGPCLAHLARIGVTAVVVIDAGSTDDTRAIARLAGATVVTRPDWVTDYASESSYLVDLAKNLGTDWVLILDADEFPIPRGGHLSKCRLTADVLSLPRYNTVSDVEDVLANPLEAWLLDGPDETAWRVNAGVPIVTLRPQPKVMARRSVIRGIAPGGHDVVTDATASRAMATDLLIAHVAISSWHRFATKVDNIRAEMEKNPGFFENENAWHWRRWAAMDEAALTAEYLLNEPSVQNLTRWQQQRLVTTAGETR